MASALFTRCSLASALFTVSSLVAAFVWSVVLFPFWSSQSPQGQGMQGQSCSFFCGHSCFSAISSHALPSLTISSISLMLRNKKNRRSSWGSGRPLASKRAATQKLQRATAAPSSSLEAQRAIAPSPEGPPSLPAITAPPSSLSMGTFAPFASLPSALFPMPSFASGSSPEQLIEESTTLSALLEAHAAAHKFFAQVLRSKVVGLETRTSPLPASANETPLPSKVIGLEEVSLVAPPAATSITTSLTTPTPTTGETAASCPRESIDSIAARNEFCQDPRCRPFFAPSICNPRFFFEEGDESFAWTSLVHFLQSGGGISSASTAFCRAATVGKPALLGRGPPPTVKVSSKTS